MIDKAFFKSFDPSPMSAAQVEAVKETAETIISLQADLQRRIVQQGNQIAVALAYLKADQPHLARLVLEGMEP